MLTSSKALLFQQAGACSSTNMDEIDMYCQVLIPFEMNENILHWWKTQEMRFPFLFRLAMDRLSIQSSSTAVERVNSEAGLEFNDSRLRLSTNIFIASMCIRSWDVTEVYWQRKNRREAAKKLAALEGAIDAIENEEEWLEEVLAIGFVETNQTTPAAIT